MLYYTHTLCNTVYKCTILSYLQVYNLNFKDKADFKYGCADDWDKAVSI